jgi:hypothetical protein
MKLATLLAATLILAVTAHAQEARLTGTVTDPSGAVLVDVSITAVQTDRNVPSRPPPTQKVDICSRGFPLAGTAFKPSNPAFEPSPSRTLCSQPTPICF